MKRQNFNHVGVILGGTSREREISIQSGRAVAAGLRQAGYTVDELDVSDVEFSFPPSLEAVFIALHGALGEDGQIQKKLEDLRIPYTGTKAADLPESFDKILTKKKLTDAKLPTPTYGIFREGKIPSMEPPFVIKPPREGSSIGLHRVFLKDEIDNAFKDAYQHDKELLVEKYIEGREFTVGMINRTLLPIVEIIAKNNCFDFMAKYTSDSTKFLVPAPLKKEQEKELMVLARHTFELFRCRHLGRVDFRMGKDGKFYILELNSIPGFTEASLLPKSALAAGITFVELCHQIMNEASL